MGAAVPIPDVPGASGWILDKPVHLCEYLLFAWLVLQAVRDPRMTPVKQAALALTIPIAYGGAMELVQYFLPYRSAEWADMAANTVGAVIGLILGLATADAMQRVEAAWFRQ